MENKVQNLHVAASCFFFKLETLFFIFVGWNDETNPFLNLDIYSNLKCLEYTWMQENNKEKYVVATYSDINYY